MERSERLEDLPLKNSEEGGNYTDEEDLDEQDRENIELPSEFNETETAGVQNNDNTMETDNANSKIISHTNRPSLTRR